MMRKVTLDVLIFVYLKFYLILKRIIVPDPKNVQYNCILCNSVPKCLIPSLK